MFTLSVRKEAEADILEAFQYYESCQLDLGLDFLNCLELAFEDIQQHPYQYPALHRSIHRTLIRRFPFGVFYTVWEQRIVVLAVLHVRRNPSHWLGRSDTSQT